jgi:glycerate kinase
MELKRVVLIPDSFKGTLSSAQICALASDCIHRHFPACEVDPIPVADGGEGSVDCFLAACGGEKRTLSCQGPFASPVEGFYGVLPDGTAVLEMAACAALPLAERLAAPGKTDPARTTTYGVGELLLHAAESGCRKILAIHAGDSSSTKPTSASLPSYSRGVSGRGGA